MARLWRNAHAASEGLRAEDGSRYLVVYPGRDSGGAGPDFRDSVLITETGDLLTGDVELHVAAPDWRGHRHNVDPNYNGVVLHVVLHTKGVRTSPQQSRAHVPVVSLLPHVETLRRSEGTPPEPLAWARNLDESGLGAALDRAGDQRFHGRSRGFALELQFGGPEQVLYGALMEGLRYAVNRKPFRELARKVPFSLLRELGREPPATRLLAIKGMLLGAAGLLAQALPADELSEVRGLLQRLPATPKMEAERWTLSRVRPANHPARRVAGAAYLLDRYLGPGLAGGIEEEIGLGGARRLLLCLSAPPLIGRGRAVELAVNVVLPFMHALAGLGRDGTLAGRFVALYQDFPKPDDNAITREMRRLLSLQSAKAKIDGARRHQGLIHLYRAMTVPGRATGPPGSGTP